ncbi:MULTISPECIES: bifunctional 4-hydroxy-2-oxoglutarate aldolase/2-dehydro-3-deoxy-phosphogluconate aldolase [Caldilinea]|jgi:2-dehydro-3-deoxyphosphogluconate aldolase/(4S)-4-hydroxy-2-oxoglutarate aldolase|uniref:Putative aldolase n=1 Tax=Caldilinea aerophila (strain DSM 14535 / JCM 11387 / NBRC 104270 / STL-6-O1) TaxID=926550 RepID=I0IA15_CALAS|nr:MULTISPECIES: bifunctional 4-hydroxy-2-oxoglutarate aldolase/2-dehydro-3-deoxy-phosphogluconate aldolase [Caldilinea]MBO9392152.1 bifunctional 4-hydroxy-2-oxoglutarate aldolase/2-dehydro-3-deoxy-phosphogluconate aldolase [Caldilinea sp.]BAM02103.1 putative aldolase [Caldilinea aerophila DSM 14535 = NBRC 104270]GIV75302.1 MAG: ketohydroxyglutarate aldolase [Caldilinea sp.]
MDKLTILSQIEKLGLLAVLRGPSPELTVAMADALVAGGVRGIEITYTTPKAEEVVATLKRQYGLSIVLGMGTLTEPEQVEEALAAGAQFLVSPHCDPILGQRMVASGVLAMIGALTPTEVLQAHRLGADVVKLFPGSLGGPSYMQSLRGPFPQIRMMPTGGVNLSNVAEWFKAGAVAIGVGSELCPAAWAKEGRFDEITARAREFVAAVAAAR